MGIWLAWIHILAPPPVSSATIGCFLICKIRMTALTVAVTATAVIAVVRDLMTFLPERVSFPG